MGFLRNKMSRDGKVQNAVTRLKRRHDAIIAKRKKDREVAVEKEPAAKVVTPTTTPAKEAISSSSSSSRDGIGPGARTSVVVEPDSAVPKRKTSNNNHKENKGNKGNDDTMPSVAEWLLWGDDDASSQKRQSGANGNNDKAATTKNSPPRKNVRSISQSPRRKIPRASASVGTPISQVESSLISASFDDSQLDSHYYSEFTDDNTADTFADITLASSQEPGLLTHGLMAVGELFTIGLSKPPPPPIASPPRRRRTRTVTPSRRRLRSYGEGEDEEGSFDDGTSVGDSLTTNQVPVTKGRSASTTDTTASSVPSDEGRTPEPNVVSPRTTTARHSKMFRGKVNPKCRTKSSVNIIESDPLAVELSLETFTRMEI